MKKTTILLIILLIILLSALSIFNSLYNPISEEYKIIRIQPDGSIHPKTNSIQKNGNTYTFNRNFFGQIIVDNSNIIIDGAGYSLFGHYNGTRTDSWVVGQGPQQNTSSIPWIIGIDLANAKCSNLTVKNLNIHSFYIAMYLWTQNNTITKNIISENIVGILLSGDSNSLTNNFIENNEEGIFFGVNTPGNEPLNIELYQNSFVENKVQFSGCFCEETNTAEAIHTWDNGQRGNYWSDYQGIDKDNNGIGDTPYIIDALNQDRYPLMEPIKNEE